MDDKLTQAIDTINRAQEKAITTVKKYSTPKTIASIIEVIISSLCIFGVQLIVIGFDFSVLKTPAFWVKCLFLTLGIYMLYRGVINARYQKTATRENVVKVRNKYNKLNESKKLDLKEYLTEVNLASKVETYVASINKKIFRLENKLFKVVKGQRIEKLNQKIDSLKSLITKEYINENIDKIKIKYFKIYFSDFNDENIATSKIGETRISYDKAFNKASINKIWMYLVITAILGVTTRDAVDNGALSIAMSFAMTSLMIITRVATALIEADKIYDRTITQSLINRTIVLEQYLEWQHSHPQVNEFQKQLGEAKEKMKIEYEQKTKLAIESALTEFAKMQNKPEA